MFNISIFGPLLLQASLLLMDPTVADVHAFTGIRALALVHVAVGAYAVEGVPSFVGPTVTGVHALALVHAVAGTHAVAGVSACNVHKDAGVLVAA